MIRELIKVANELDRLGYVREADELDKLIVLSGIGDPGKSDGEQIADAGNLTMGMGVLSANPMAISIGTGVALGGAMIEGWKGMSAKDKAAASASVSMARSAIIRGLTAHLKRIRAEGLSWEGPGGGDESRRKEYAGAVRKLIMEWLQPNRKHKVDIKYIKKFFSRFTASDLSAMTIEKEPYGSGLSAKIILKQIMRQLGVGVAL